MKEVKILKYVGKNGKDEYGNGHGVTFIAYAWLRLIKTDDCIFYCELRSLWARRLLSVSYA